MSKIEQFLTKLLKKFFNFKEAPKYLKGKKQVPQLSGQSIRLLSGMSQVRILQGPPIKFGLVVKRLIRLPVTQKITGSIPVWVANIYQCRFANGTGIKASCPTVERFNSSIGTNLYERYIMKWILVYLFFSNNEITSQEIDKFDIMTDCFEVRETMMRSMGSTDGYFPINHQAICIRIQEQSANFGEYATRCGNRM